MQLSLFEQSVLEGVSARGTTPGCYDYVASKTGLTKLDMQEKVFRGDKAGFVGKWQHKIRLIQQKLKSLGLVEKSEKRGEWRITNKGRNKLTFAPRNSLKVYFHNQNGVAFWGDSSHIPELFDSEIDLIVTSPPYLLSKAREYGDIGMNEKDYVDNLVLAIEKWLPSLTPTASIVLNIGESIKKGEGYQNLHRERLLIALHDRLGLKLVQRFTWHSPTKMPTGFWVTQAKRDCVNTIEDFYWLSLNPKTCKANNQNVKIEYSEKQKSYIASSVRKSGVRQNPSGQMANDNTFYKDNGGAIPSTLLIATPESANSEYSQFCKEQGLQRHPAMLDESLPDFFVRYLTDRDDVVFDPYLGSGTTCSAASKQGRNWIGGELVKEYLDGAKIRFN